MKSTAHRYGTVAILVHWITALLVLILFFTGFSSAFTEDALAKVAALRVHLPVAILVLLLTLLRLLWWWRYDRRPPPVEGMPKWQDHAARWTHRSLYLLLLILLGSGIGLTALSGLPFAVFGEEPMPNLMQFPPKAAHGVAAFLTVALVALHAVAALHHHFFLRDRTLTRMWFLGKDTANFREDQGSGDV